MENSRHKGSFNAERLAQGLGWFSIGLGLVEVLAPRRVSRWVGMSERPWLIRLFGLREMATGLGILTQRRPAGWVWSRVGGDVMDLAVLGAAFNGAGSRPGRVAAATAAVAGVTALDVFCGQELCRNGKASHGATHVEASLIINRPPEEVYRFWRDFQNLPRFMEHLVSVEETSGTRSDLYQFKQVMETGEIARTKGQPAGRPRSPSRKYDDLAQR